MMNFGRRWLSVLMVIGMIGVAPWRGPVARGQEPASTVETAPPSTDESSGKETPTPTEEILAPLEEPAPKPETLIVPETPTGTTKYTVKKGDTLWGISNSYLRDSFLWPKLWKNNQYILDPDLIYPGNILELPGKEALLREARIETQLPQQAATSVPPRMIEKPVPMEPERRVELTAPEQPAPAAKPLDLEKALLETSGYILTGPTAEGIVVGTRDNRELIGQGEIAYLLPKKGSSPRIGDRYTLYRVVEKVYHPITGKYLGELIRILGQTEVTGADPKEETVTSKVFASYDSIQKGDFLMPTLTPQESSDQTVSSLSGNRLDGFIVEVKENRVSHSQFDVVYLDRGRQDGVHSGDRFTIVREGEKTSFFSPGGGVRLPRRVIGELQVIAVQDVTATAKIIQSTEVIHKGDRFETSPPP